MGEPKEKRAVAFFDGQNLFHHAKEAFGHKHPNYDPKSLFDAICADKGWNPQGVRFYTGVPPANRSAMWNGYWSKRFLAMRRADILVTSRFLRYHDEKVQHPDGSQSVVSTAQEKGIDLRLGLDVVRLARSNQYDVAVIFSQDQDLAEVVGEVREISQETGRWIKIACAFPSGARATTNRGIARTDWIKISQSFYDQNLDPRDYRPRRSR